MTEKVFVITSRCEYEDTDYTRIDSVHKTIESATKALDKIREDYRADKTVNILGEQWYKGDFYHVTYLDARLCEQKYNKSYDIEEHELAD